MQSAAKYKHASRLIKAKHDGGAMVVCLCSPRKRCSGQTPAQVDASSPWIRPPCTQSKDTLLNAESRAPLSQPLFCMRIPMCMSYIRFRFNATIFYNGPPFVFISKKTLKKFSKGGKVMRKGFVKKRKNTAYVQRFTFYSSRLELKLSIGESTLNKFEHFQDFYNLGYKLLCWP